MYCITHTCAIEYLSKNKDNRSNITLLYSTNNNGMCISRRYDTTRYGRLTCSQKLTRWAA